MHYAVRAECGRAPCALPLHAQVRFLGGNPTPVPPLYTQIRLSIEPAPGVMPAVRWMSLNPSIVAVRRETPFQHTLQMPGDTAATPAPDLLQSFVVPKKRGETIVVAEIGAPVNERIEIPVYSSGNDDTWSPPHTTANSHLTVKPIGGSTQAVTFNARIAYADPVTSTYGTASKLFTEMPWPKGTGGFFQSFGSVRVDVSPRPYRPPAVTWRIYGTAATLAQQHFGAFGLADTAILHGVRPGTSSLQAHVGAPLNRDFSIPIVTYATLVLPCHRGVRFAPDGTLTFTTDRQRSDLFADCTSVWVPHGGILLTNGNDPKRAAARGAYRGPQFPDLTVSAWRNAFTVLDAKRYDNAIEPCAAPESPGVERILYGCTTMPARTLLFRTSDGHYVKWLIQNGNGLFVLAGPYEVLSKQSAP